MKMLWKVPMTTMAAALAPTIAAMRSFISPAAFLVKVRARMDEGRTSLAERI